MSFMIESACYCHMGRVRTSNQDNFYFAEEILPKENNGLAAPLSCSQTTEAPLFFGVFDGMGGEQQGELAAWIAAKTLQDADGLTIDDPETFLLNVCQKANQRICVEMERQKCGRIGTTAAMTCFQENTGWLCNIGDSRIFLLRDGKLRQISEDHTEAAMMKKHGITGRKPRLTQHLGIFPDEMLIEPFCTKITLRPEDRILLCSDGLTDMVGVESIPVILRGNIPPEQATRQLVNDALRQGGQDNVTAILCDVMLL